MKQSAQRLLTTHVGSLPRPQSQADLLVAGERGLEVDPDQFEAETAAAVDQVVASQIAAGIDVVNDGEMSKPSYATYLRHRVEGIVMSEEAAERGRDAMVGLDLLDHPDFAERITLRNVKFPGCVAPLRYADRQPLERDLAHLRTAVDKHGAAGAFMTAPSPGILTRFIVDLHYNDYGRYLEAWADVLKTEYEAIVAAGFVLQIDAPDLASARSNQHRDKTDEEFRAISEQNVEALNAATAGIPADRMRMHLCWGNYAGPHTHDIPLIRIIDVAFKARPQAISFEGANPRHAHEWAHLQEIRIPDDKILIPGVIDSTTNIVEHPELVAQRLQHYIDLVGRQRVIAGADCGFGTIVTGAPPTVAPSVVWAKFASLAEGARRVSERAAR